jgi:CCR4-NOT transcriptional regulation complex NOT5 subunit
MTNKLIEPLKTFLEITNENLKWAANEIQHQYFLSTLRDIEKKYPELHTEVEALIEHLDAIFYDITDEDCPDFVEPPEEIYFRVIVNDAENNSGVSSTSKIDRNGTVTNVDLTNLKEGDYLSNRFGAPDDGLNEPDYPCDTEPSA